MWSMFYGLTGYFTGKDHEQRYWFRDYERVKHNVFAQLDDFSCSVMNTICSNHGLTS